MDSEHRKRKRLHANLPVHVTLLDEAGGIPVNSEGRLYDLSPGGCAFYHTLELPIGLRVQLRIDLNDDLRQKFNQPELTARGAICRIQRHGSEYLLSVRFFK